VKETKEYMTEPRHLHVTLCVDIAKLEQSLKLGLVHNADVNNLLGIVRKTVKKTHMVIYLN